jgi:ribulose-5-phosphate 4-epimerase/fuculose-1-phosphate aldolase
MTEIERAKQELVISSRILVNQRVLDAFGHLSVRHPLDPERFLLSRSCSPGMVLPADIVEFTLEGDPIGPETRPLYLERFIHGAIYEARGDVRAVLHAHAEDVLPFCVTKVPFRPVIQSAGDIGLHIPVWDIAEKFGDGTDLLVATMEQARDLARCLGAGRMALMRSHGFVTVGSSLYDIVRMSIYMVRNARVLTTAMRMGEVGGLSAGEVAARLALDPNAPAMRRGWEFWAKEAGCDGLF